ncbi:MATE family efflux transporter [Legionella parisiensis]|uniref:Multidrug resistance protein MdtK n=1 Tax=Legionella parisiensis TaxID=45071 RepID=A0A1E5JQD4_9GAMM|nr:MATE family efflux transporter [Legionella parisiensis]KTD40248.1 multidrug efflux protein [Legionella parisiensis]OEH46744.1 Multidrug resistance protein MdtK [Legionella parisiensis]STX77640.1 multidrug efflux protein [Legionella parisiensis]
MQQKNDQFEYKHRDDVSINSTHQDLHDDKAISKIPASLEKQSDVEGVLIENGKETPFVDDEEVEGGDYYGLWRVFKELSSLSLPMALSFTFSFEIFLMVVLLNSLSENEDEVASATLISTMINTFLVIGMAPLFSMSVIASNKIGELTEDETNGETNEIVLQEKREYIAGINRNGLFLSALVTPPVMMGLIFSKPLLTTLFGQSEHVAEITQNFLRIYSPAVGAVMTRISSEQMMFSFGHAKPAMFLGLANLAIGTGVGAWLGFGGLGVPRLGGTGIAIGYVIEAYLTSISYALYLAKHKNFSQYEFFNIFKRFSGQFKQFIELLQIGSSITLSVASEMAMSLSVSILSGMLGTKDQAAITYLNQYIFFNFLMLAGFGQSNSQEINRLIGAKKYENASRMGKYGLLTTLIYTTPVPLFFAVMPGVLIIGKAPNQVSEILKYLAPIVSTGVILDSARYNLLQQLRVLKDLKGSTIISVSALSLGITGSALLGLKTKLGIYGVAAGYTGGVIIAIPGLVYRWHNRINAEKIKEISEEPQMLTSSAHSPDGFFSSFLKIKNKGEKESLLEHKGQTYSTTENGFIV